MSNDLAATVKEALALLEIHHVDAAIVDVNLSDRDISPVAELLMAREVPVIFHTGLGVPDELNAKFPNLVVHLKPLVPEQLIRQLAALIESPRTESIPTTVCRCDGTG
jgi:DNA-binding response OmpR family regulator